LFLGPVSVCCSIHAPSLPAHPPRLPSGVRRADTWQRTSRHQKPRDVDLSPSDRLSEPRAGNSAVSLCDGTILVVGGMADATAPAERYSPPSLGRR
jgi:hypothetical protein